MKIYDPNELYLIVPEIANVFKFLYDNKCRVKSKKRTTFRHSFLFTLDSLKDLEKVIKVITPDLPSGVKFFTDTTKDPIFTVYSKDKVPTNYIVYLTTESK